MVSPKPLIIPAVPPPRHLAGAGGASPSLSAAAAATARSAGVPKTATTAAISPGATGSAPAPLARRRPLLRPLVRAERISFFEREVRERLSRAAVEVLFAAAAIMSEGQRSARNGREAFFGSTMLTIELESVAAAVRDACDARSAQRLAALLATDSNALARIKDIAAGEVQRLCGTRARSLSTEVKVRGRGTTIYVDVDMEAQV